MSLIFITIIKMPNVFIWMKLIIIIIIIIVIVVVVVVVVVVNDMLHGLKKTQYMPAANT